jgi:hypothetical protein
MKYKYQYELLLDGVKENEAMAEGISFHTIMAGYAKTRTIGETSLPMGDVASVYLTHRKFPTNIRLVEEPIYVEFLPGVYVRGTCDLIYESEDGTLVVRDWKTFARLPSLDSDLDFQARLYIALVMRHYKTTKVRFEHEYVRKTPPFIPKDKAGNVWQPEDCYLTESIVVSVAECAQIVQEVRWELESLLKTKENGNYTRTNLKGGGYDSCASCSVKEICKAELTNGELNDSLLYGISRKREAIEIPEDLK